MDRSLLHGVAWNGALKLLAQAVTWSASLVVARLLTAGDYGVYGLAVLFLGVVQMGTEFGIGMAVVTRLDLGELDFAELNTVAVAFGVGGALVMALFAPVAGIVFHQPALVAVLLAMSLTLVISSLRSVPWGLLQRGLRFRRLAVYDATQAIALAGFSVALAAAGFRYWTLVIAALVAATASTVVTLARHAVPFARPDLARLRSVLTFSRELVVGRLAWYAYLNADFVVASRVLGTERAGYYGLAWTTAHLVVDKVAQLVFQVTPGVLSRVQDDTAQLRRYLVQISAAMSLVCWPLTIGLALAARDFVPVLLGARWQPIVFPLAVLSAYSSVWILLGLMGQLMLIVGEQAFLRRNNVRQLVVMTTAFVIGSRWGIDGIALSWLFVHPVFAAWAARRVLRRLDIGPAVYVRDALLPGLVGCAAMAAVVLALRATVLAGLPAPWRLAGVVLAGGATYGTVQLTVFRGRMASSWAAYRLLRAQASI